MIASIEQEFVVDVSNVCLSDYNQFVKMSSSQLAKLQDDYYLELHVLQNELDDLLNELRSSLRSFS